MAEMVHERLISLVGTDGQMYAVVRVYAQPMPKGAWEGWLEFTTEAGDRVVTDRETTQSKLQDVAYWASGLEPVFLEGALARALHVPLSSV